MEKYILLNWPASQPFQSNRKCIPSPEGEPGDMLVPEKIYLKSLGKKEPALELLRSFDASVSALLSFIEKNVPERGIRLTKEEIADNELRVCYCNHFSGELSYATVKAVYPGRLTVVDDYGNDTDRCSLACDVAKENLREIAAWLMWKKNKYRV